MQAGYAFPVFLLRHFNELTLAVPRRHPTLTQKSQEEKHEEN